MIILIQMRWLEELPGFLELVNAGQFAGWLGAHQAEKKGKPHSQVSSSCRWYSSWGVWGEGRQRVGNEAEAGQGGSGMLRLCSRGRGQ